MQEYRTGSHTVYDVKYHFVWVTKYRKKILKGEIGVRTRDVLREICISRELRILKGHVGKDHVHLLLSCPTTIAPSKVVQYLKGKSSRILQMEFETLKKAYWGQHMWAGGYFCVTSGNITDEMISEYIENQAIHHKDDDFTTD